MIRSWLVCTGYIEEEHCSDWFFNRMRGGLAFTGVAILQSLLGRIDVSEKGRLSHVQIRIGLTILPVSVDDSKT